MSGISAATARTARSDATARVSGDAALGQRRRRSRTRRRGRLSTGQSPRNAADYAHVGACACAPQEPRRGSGSQTGVPLTLDPADPDYKATAPFLSHTTNEMALPGPKLTVSSILVVRWHVKAWGALVARVCFDCVL